MGTSEVCKEQLNDKLTNFSSQTTAKNGFKIIVLADLNFPYSAKSDFEIIVLADLNFSYSAKSGFKIIVLAE